MEQFNVPEELKIPINYQDETLPLSVQTLHPLVYQDGDIVAVVLGPNPEQGIVGRGATTAEAVIDWDRQFLHLIMNCKDDEVTKYAIDTMSAAGNKVG
jgi:hypothetical protein